MLAVELSATSVALTEIASDPFVICTEQVKLPPVRVAGVSLQATVVRPESPSLRQSCNRNVHLRAGDSVGGRCNAPGARSWSVDRTSIADRTPTDP